MWQHKELQPNFRQHGWKESDFVTKTMAARGGPSNSTDNTLNRPRMDLGGNHNNHYQNNGASQHTQNNTSVNNTSFQHAHYPNHHHQAGEELHNIHGSDTYGRVNEPIRVSNKLRDVRNVECNVYYPKSSLSLSHLTFFFFRWMSTQ